jgi:hypothetical protein
MAVMTGFLRLVALSCAFVALAGCGGGDDPSANAPVTFAQLADAAGATADASSGRFDFSFELDLPETDDALALTGSGSFDADAKRSSISLDLSSLAQMLGGLFAGAAPPAANAPDFGDPAGWKIEVVTDREVVYLRFPAFASELPPGKSWVRIEAGEEARAQGLDLGQLDSLTATDPQDVLELLRGVSGEVETVGTEELRGVETTHYRGRVSLADYDELVPEENREQLRELFDQMLERSGLGELPIDVWLDEEGLVRRLQATFSATDSATAETLAASLGFELYDYGESVDVVLPPATQVVDAADLE